MAKHRAESETHLTGTVATRGLLTAVAALAVTGGPAAGMALADEAVPAQDAAQQESYNGADGANGSDGASGANGSDVSDASDDGQLHAKDRPGQKKDREEKRGQDGKDGKDGQRGQDGAGADSSSLTPPAIGADGATGQAPAFGGLANPLTPVLGNDVGF